MPELPEVETIKNDLKKYIINKKISSLKVNKRKIIKCGMAGFKRLVVGSLIKNIDRVGKLLIFYLSNNKYLLVHLKMTGQLVYCNKSKVVAGGHSLKSKNDQTGIGGELPNKYSHVIFYFSDGGALYFNDMRQFGYLKVVAKDELEKIIGEYGIEPLTDGFRAGKLKELFKNRKVSVKSAIMNQRLIAGIGNIYADEILWMARIKPWRKARSMKLAELEKIVRAANSVIKKAIKYRGTTFNNYRDGQGKKGDFIRFLNVYGRVGERCKNCKNGLILRKKMAGRSTHYCSKCQR